jgi:hypothetical protein
MGKGSIIIICGLCHYIPRNLKAYSIVQSTPLSLPSSLLPWFKLLSFWTLIAPNYSFSP